VVVHLVLARASWQLWLLLFWVILSVSSKYLAPGRRSKPRELPENALSQWQQQRRKIRQVLRPKQRQQVVVKQRPPVGSQQRQSQKQEEQ